MTGLGTSFAPILTDVRKDATVVCSRTSTSSLLSHPKPVPASQVGGGGGDVALEFLDVREAALVSVAEALARRSLPWQAQLCPRALQDLEVARVRVRDRHRF